MSTEQGRERTRAATAKMKRNAEERWATRLRERGWVCIPDVISIDEQLDGDDRTVIRTITIRSLSRAEG